MTRTVLHSTLLMFVTGTTLLGTLPSCSTSHAKTEPRPEAATLRVDEIAVVERSIPKTLVLTGTLLADRESEVMADVAGKVIQTFGDLGDNVKAGAPLARLDARVASLTHGEARAQVALAHAQQENSERECARAKMLFDNGALSRSAYDNMTTSCATAQHSASAASARQALAAQAIGDSVLRAPFSGWIATRGVEVGEYVVPGTRVATVVDTRRLRLKLSVPEAATSVVSRGGSVRFTVAAFPERPFEARIERLGPVVDPASREQTVEASVDNPNGLLRPGMFASARLVIGQSKVPVVPISALSGSEGSRRVFVIRAGRLEERLVQVGETQAGVAPILKGLATRERVVAHAKPDLKDGARLQ